MQWLVNGEIITCINSKEACRASIGNNFSLINLIPLIRFSIVSVPKHERCNSCLNFLTTDWDLSEIYEGALVVYWLTYREYIGQMDPFQSSELCGNFRALFYLYFLTYLASDRTPSTSANRSVQSLPLILLTSLKL